MSVAHYHLRAKSIGKSGTVNAVAAAAYRSGGRGVVASAAYRAAERLTEDNGRVYDFTAKKGVEDAFILVPKDAPIWAADRGKLWNAAEAAEKRANGRVATELEISLPKELNSEQRRELITGFIQSFVDRYGVAADIALHVGDDPRNLHAHCVLTHRELTRDGFGDIACRHTVMRGDWEIPVAGIAATPRDIIKLRKLWEDHVNAAYRKAGLDLTVDSRSYQEQGLDIRPQLYLGPEHKNNPELEKERQQRIEYNKRIKAEREKAALDQAHEHRHEAPKMVAERPLVERPEVAAVIAGWHAPAPPEAPKPPLDHLADDLMLAITSALQTRDPQEQRDRLADGVDRAIDIRNPSEPPSPLARSLMRVATSALLIDGPERMLTEGTREAVRRHDVRRRQVETAREPATEAAAEAQEEQKPEEVSRVAPERSLAPAASERHEARPPTPPSPVEARQLTLTHTAIQLQRERATAAKALEYAEQNRDVAIYRQAERRGQMGFFARLLHDHTSFKDYDLKGWEGQRRGAEYGVEKQSIQLKAISDRLEAIEAERTRLRERADRERRAQAYWQRQREPLEPLHDLQEQQKQRQGRRLRM